VRSIQLWLLVGTRTAMTMPSYKLQSSVKAPVATSNWLHDLHLPWMCRLLRLADAERTFGNRKLAHLRPKLNSKRQKAKHTLHLYLILRNLATQRRNRKYGYHTISLPLQVTSLPIMLPRIILKLFYQSRYREIL
jgi:hypothetical protein